MFFFKGKLSNKKIYKAFAEKKNRTQFWNDVKRFLANKGKKIYAQPLVMKNYC